MLHKRYEGNNINKLTGVVWKCCGNIETAVLDTKAVIISDIQTHMATMKDALEELEEAAEADDADDVDDDFDDDDGLDDFGDFGDQKLSKEDKKAVPAVTLVLKTCSSICTQAVKYLSSVEVPPPADSTTDEAQATINWMGAVVDTVAQLSELVDELVQAVYPVQIRDNLVALSKKVRACMVTFVAQLKESEGRIDTAMVAKLEKTIQAFMDKADEMLSRQ